MMGLLGLVLSCRERRRSDHWLLDYLRSFCPQRRRNRWSLRQLRRLIHLPLLLQGELVLVGVECLLVRGSGVAFRRGGILQRKSDSRGDTAGGG